MEHVGYKGPGKFEGEPCYAEHFYTACLEGGADDFYDGCTQVSRLDVTAEDVAAFPCCLETADIGKAVILWETEQGFVYTRLMDTAEADKIQAECEADECVDCE